ncbi:DUF3883 domain-containing protein [Photobacterium damselae]|uniref:DUF3883 domain-containing protein n=1 Tax=Photobacterium damselae TaxID=38293 RepID=UPI0015E675F1|nr:DUF3883 domain-containing protein [Photobacterium damselae]
MNNTITKKQEILEYRKNKYDIDESTGHSLLKYDIKNDLHNSIQTLSEQLYSKDVHFVFELIQNAEDNHYSAGVEPKLHFELLDIDPTGTAGAKGCLAIYNNEEGFELKNVRAVSSVGGSTKKNSKDSGYIGEKGIGFKSVFSVTPSPHIYSNGFQFSFRDNDEKTGLGYIIPYWEETVPNVVREKLITYNTCILLPLRDDPERDCLLKIRQELNNLDTSLLLFLNKISELTVNLDGSTRRYAKEEHDSYTALINESEGRITTTDYIVRKKTILVPEELKESKRENVTKRELCLAFPITTSSRKHKVYSYLPTEIHSGLPFLVNADFLLPASRESILVDREWNLWMQSELANFASKEINELVTTEPSSRSFHWIPVHNDCTSEFFKPVFDRVIDCLKDLDFIPNTFGQLISPNNAHYSPRSLANLLEKMGCFESEYGFVATDVLYFDKQLKPIVAHKTIEVDTLSEFFQSASKFLKTLPMSWFVELYGWLQKQDEDWWGWYNEFKAAPIFPCQNDKLLSASDRVFRSSNININYPTLHTEENCTDIALLNVELQNELKGQTVVRAFIQEKFGIEPLTPNEYLFRVALPFCKENLSNIKADSLWEINKFTIQNWDSLKSDDLNQLSSMLPLKTRKGEFCINEQNSRVVATPKSYSPGTGWPVIYNKGEQAELLILSDEYTHLLSSYEKRSPAEVYSRLKASKNPLCYFHMKVTSSAQIPQDTFSASYTDYLTNEIRTMYSGPSRPYKKGTLLRVPSSIQSPDLLASKSFRHAAYRWIKAAQEQEQRRCINWKKRSWDFETIDYFYGSSQTRKVKTELSYVLNHLKWLPTNNGLKSLGEVFVAKGDERRIYGDALNFLDDEVPLDLIELLGVPTEVTPESVVDVLRFWSKENSSVRESDITNIYRQLQRQMYDLKELFEQEPLIYCPAGDNNWCKSKEAIWHSQATILGGNYHWLSDTYPLSTKAFWLDAGAAEQVSAEHFAEAWVRLQNSSEPNPRASLEVMMDSLVSDMKRYKNGEFPDWFDEFEQNAYCYSYKNKFNNAEWVEPSEIYAADIPKKLRAKFEEDGARFIWIPDGRQHSRYDALYSALDVKYASETLLKKADIERSDCFSPDEPLLGFWSKVLLACLVKNNSEKDLFESEPLVELIKSDEALLKHDLEVTFELGYFEVTSLVAAYFDGKTLYYVPQEDRETLKEDLAAEISQRLFKRDHRRHEDTIIRILGAGEVRAQKLMDSKGWKLTKKETAEFNRLFEQKAKALEREEESIIEPANDQSFAYDSFETKPTPSGEGQTVKEPEQHSEAVREEHDNRERKTRINDSIQTGPTGRTQVPGTKTTRTNPTDRKNKSSGSGSRMISYVKPKDDSKVGSSDSGSEHTMAYANRAEEIVTKLLENQGYEVALLGGTNPGFDIKVKSGDEDIFVEVKSTQGAWNNTGIGLSSRQFELSQKVRSNYWLYIVEYADTEEPKVYKLVSPAEKVDAFYFDKNWKELAIQEEQKRVDDAGDLGIYELFEGDIEKLYEDL